MLAVCFVAGYLVAGWWSGEDDTTPLQEICARVDYVNGLQEKFKGQEAASEEVRAEFKKLIEQCRMCIKPTTNIANCCARAASGHATAPPSTVTVHLGHLVCCICSRPVMAQSVSAASSPLRLVSNEQRTQLGRIVLGRP
jgi:hypothetical protein